MKIQPNVKILSRREVYEGLGVSTVTLWRMVRDGQFPKPIRISARRVGWSEESVRAWLTDRAEAA